MKIINVFSNTKWTVERHFLQLNATCCNIRWVHSNGDIYIASRPITVYLYTKYAINLSSSLSMPQLNGTFMYDYPTPLITGGTLSLATVRFGTSQIHLQISSFTHNERPPPWFSKSWSKDQVILYLCNCSLLGFIFSVDNIGWTNLTYDIWYSAKVCYNAHNTII